MDIEFYIKALKSKLEKQLPGIEAQKRMAPTHRINPEYEPNPENAVQSAVLVLIFPYKSGLGTVLMERTADTSVHSKQISLPGGKAEDDDLMPEHTALRETWEEIGVKPEAVEVLGKLSSLFIPVSNFTVIPVVGFLKQMPVFELNAKEVELVLVEELDEIINSAGTAEVFAGKFGVCTVPVYLVGGKTVWGATAMILAEFFTLHLQIKASY
ncbi:MAG TPA: coenzyme A pyrophosphatase [Bacteroidales bacterium]|nr:coenzyme A pyrophosphatase [Bacteroidales bacterium]